jgi:hypothetical protein
MIREKKPKRHNSPIVIDLDGPDGNAFVLLGMAKGWAKQIGFNWDEIRVDATSGDYEHLLKVLDSHFGSFVIFERAKNAKG